MSAAAALVAPGAVFDAFAGAREIALSAYTLVPGGRAERALEAASDRGAAVSVTLEGFAGRPATDGLRRSAARVAAGLRSHGVTVCLGVPSGAGVHLKAAVVDGTAYLADRNWTEDRETVLATAVPGDVAAVREAIAGCPVSTADLATEKLPALALESGTIRAGSGDRVDLESESFGACAVTAALRERAAAGAHVRLLVNGRIALGPGARAERAVLRGLAAAGVEVRTTTGNEKLCIAGDSAWVGSANATYEYEPTTDWGYVSADPALNRTLAATFEVIWRTARPFS